MTVEDNLRKFAVHLGVCPHTFETAEETEFEAHFGVCPKCFRTDGYINVGKGHWFYCRAHRVCWFAGSNLFGRWMDQTEDEQRRIYDELGMGEFEHIEPSMSTLYPPEPFKPTVVGDPIPY